MFITAFTNARHMNLFLASSIQSTPHINLPEDPPEYNPHVYAWVFFSGFPTKTLYMPLPSPIQATCPGRFILLYLITRTILGEEYRSLSSTL
jgi:hypothetical protein